ncbi:MAG TPA: ornithine cyclodeaminase family protein [Actinomycetota bacterium]|nr:ornithine cyclodeaminase family protein [Actinomycetota bacterium]
MTLSFIDEEKLHALLPMSAAIDALEAAFAAPELPEAPPRTFVSLDEGDLGLMPAGGPMGAGVKVITINGDNPQRGLPLIHGVYVLFAPGTLESRGVIEGGALTGMRTAAVSGVATRCLARADASRLVVFGAGVQARSHLEAMRAVRDIESVTIVSRTRSRAEALALAAHSTGLEANVGGPDAVAEADIVCTCTTSDAPLFEGAMLSPGAHVNAVGTYRPDARELDAEVMRRASRVVVESRASALEEAGDVVLALGDGALAEDDLVELRDAVRDGGARATEEITVFKSVGLAVEDLVVASAAFERLG